MTRIERFLRQEGGEELLSMFQNNYENYPLQDMWEGLGFSDYLYEMGDNIDVINEAFEWGDAPEGDDFWYRLYDKYRGYFANNKPRLIQI